MEDAFVTLRLIVYSTNLAIYLAGAIYLIIMQLLLWSIARHSADIELWRTGAFCLLVGSMTFFGLAMGGVEGIASAVILGLIAGWVISGFVYDLEQKHRIITTVVGPIAASLAIFLGHWLKGMIVGGMIS